MYASAALDPRNSIVRCTHTYKHIFHTFGIQKIVYNMVLTSAWKLQINFQFLACYFIHLRCVFVCTVH